MRTSHEWKPLKCGLWCRMEKISWTEHISNEEVLKLIDEEISLLCYVMLIYVMLGYVMLCYVMLCYVMLCCVVLCCVLLCYVILCYVMLYG